MGHLPKDSNPLPKAVSDLIWREQRGKAVLIPRVTLRPSLAKKYANRKDITMAEVAKHNTRDDAWLCIEGQAYDITSYIDKHPGGVLTLLNLAGKDATDAFANYHPASVYQQFLPNYYIGEVIDYSVSPFVKAHREIRQELLRKGLFETSKLYYVKMCSWYLFLMFSALYLNFMCESYAAHLLGAVVWALFFQQSSFFGHDIGHTSISHDMKTDHFWGLAIANITSGISFAWWKKSHNVHHVACNSIEADPNIQHLPLFAVDDSMFGKFTSTYHNRDYITTKLARFLVSYQHYLYYPVMALARFNLYAQSYKLVLSKQKVRYRNIEFWTLVGFGIWFSAMLLYCFDTWTERFVHLLVSHTLSGILHVQITLSHFAETVYHGRAYNGPKDEWFRMQVGTTLNVDCPEWMDWFHGGLQFQIEHHLFPRLPRHNLRIARTMVKAFCAEHKIPYNELPFFQANARIIQKMKETALTARTLTKGDAGFYNTPLYNGLNAIG